MPFKNSLAFIASVIISVNYFQDIPARTNAIIVKKVSFRSVINTFPKIGYRIAKIDTNDQRIESRFESVEGEITHLSIVVQMKNGDAIVTGRWWTNLAPPKGDLSKSNLIADVEYDPPRVTKFEIMNKFCELLKGKIIYTRQ